MIRPDPVASLATEETRVFATILFALWFFGPRCFER